MTNAASNVVLKETREGFIYEARAHYEDCGYTSITKTSFSVLKAVSIRTNHSTNGSRGRAFKFLTWEEMEEAFTALLLRMYIDPKDEPFLFSDIPGLPTA